MDDEIDVTARRAVAAYIGVQDYDAQRYLTARFDDLEGVIRAAITADRERQAARVAALEAALRQAIYPETWDDYEAGTLARFCRECGEREGKSHLQACDLAEVATSLA